MNNEILCNRTKYFDYLRLFATFAVIVLHTSASNLYEINVNTFSWHVFNFFDSITRWCVPIFVMISGALFLSKDISIKKLYSKYIARLLIAFLLWSAIYYFAINSWHTITVEHAIIRIIAGHYHMWFILMIIGLYMCVPFIKSFITNTNYTKYYLLLSICFTSLIPTIILLFNDFFEATVTNITSVITETIDSSDLNTMFRYSIYFVLGYYLSKTQITPRHRKFIYILGLIGFISTIVLSTHCSSISQYACSKYYQYLRFNVLLESISVFTWFKHRKHTSTKYYPLISRLSKYSFGAYMVHVLVLEQFIYQTLHINTLSFNPILSIVSISITASIISFVISGIMHQIPIVRKYMV